MSNNERYINTTGYFNSYSVYDQVNKKYIYVCVIEMKMQNL